MMWDWGSGALWEAESGDGVWDVLPLSDDVRAALRGWVAKTDAVNDRLFDEDDDEAADPELRALDADGRALWLRVRDDLRGECEVGYAVDEGDELMVIWSPEGPPQPRPWRSRE